MALLDDLAAMPPRPGYLDRGCMVCRVVWGLGEDEQAALAAALALPVIEMPHFYLLDVLAKNGYPVTRDAMTKHRKERHQDRKPPNGNS